MQQVPGNISNEDLQQWLSSCYFYHRIPKTGKYELSFMTMQHLPNGHGTWMVQHVHNDELIPLPPANELWCHWPVGGAINWVLRKCAVFTERLPKKQWKRSFCTSYYTVKKLGGLLSAEDTAYRSSKKSAIELMEPTYYSYSTITKDLFPQGWESAAVNPQITIVNGDLPKVYFNSELVGKITQDKTLYINNRSVARYVVPHFDGLVRY